MHPLKKAARIAGAIYLSMVITGPFALIYVPNKLIMRGNAAATADKLSLLAENSFQTSSSSLLPRVSPTRPSLV